MTDRPEPVIDVARTLELKVPPPVVALLVALAMWGAAGAGGSQAGPDLVRLPLALALAAIGLGLDAAGFLAFRGARTTINPMKPQSTSSIVDSGVYRLTRNPMYVGLGLLLCAWAVFLWSWWTLAGPLAFAAYITRFQIVPEERVLAARFGSEYAAYKARVRRWI